MTITECTASSSRIGGQLRANGVALGHDRQHVGEQRLLQPQVVLLVGFGQLSVFVLNARVLRLEAQCAQLKTQMMRGGRIVWGSMERFRDTNTILSA